MMYCTKCGRETHGIYCFCDATMEINFIFEQTRHIVPDMDCWLLAKGLVRQQIEAKYKELGRCLLGTSFGLYDIGVALNDYFDIEPYIRRDISDETDKYRLDVLEEVLDMTQNEKGQLVVKLRERYLDIAELSLDKRRFLTDQPYDRNLNIRYN